MPSDDARGRSPARIFISYKREAEPDVSVAQFLYGTLTRQGHRVFKDVEKIPAGDDYAELIAAEITQSDFFIALLTRASTRQGWVPAEVEMARDSADHSGHPRILPVRLAFTQPLPLRVKAAIGHLNHLEWRNPEDSEKLLGALLDVIDSLHPHGGDGTGAVAASPSRLARGEHFIVSEHMWHAGGSREVLAGTTIVPVLPDQETSLSVTRAAGPGLFRVRVAESGALEVAIWSGAAYRRVRSQPRKFITMLEGDTHAWCFARYLPDQSIALKRPDSRPDPIVVTFDQAVVRAAWMITHQRGSLHESCLIVMKRPDEG